MDCCSTVQLKSANSEETLKALGVYSLKEGSIIKNRPVYTNEESGSHLLFGLDGWKVIPSTPEDNDPPLVSFIHCKPPRESVCPDRCVNDGNWTFFSQAEGKDLLDTEKHLVLSCYNGEEDRKYDTSLILYISVGILAVFVLVTVIIVYMCRRQRQNTSKDTPGIPLLVLDPEDNTSKVDGEQHVPLRDDVEVKIEGTAEETKSPFKNFLRQTSLKFLKTKLVVNLTPDYVQMPLDQVITINCDPPINPKYPYKYDLSFTNSSNNTTIDVEVPQNGKIQFRDLELEPGEYEYKLVVKGKRDNIDLEGWKREQFKVYPGPSVERDNRKYSAEMAKNNVMLWEKSDHIIEKLPASGILNDTILFRLQELMPRNSVLKISTIKPSAVFICQGEGKKEAWSQSTLLSEPYMFSQQKDKIITSNGTLSILYASTDLIGDNLSIVLPKTGQTNSSISIFIKEFQSNKDSPKSDKFKGSSANEKNPPFQITQNVDKIDTVNNITIPLLTENQPGARPSNFTATSSDNPIAIGLPIKLPQVVNPEDLQTLGYDQTTTSDVSSSQNRSKNKYSKRKFLEQ